SATTIVTASLTFRLLTLFPTNCLSLLSCVSWWRGPPFAGPFGVLPASGERQVQAVALAGVLVQAVVGHGQGRVHVSVRAGRQRLPDADRIGAHREHRGDAVRVGIGDRHNRDLS